MYRIQAFNLALVLAHLNGYSLKYLNPTICFCLAFIVNIIIYLGVFVLKQCVAS